MFYSICERVTPRLSHANAAVVLSAVKVLMKFMELLPPDSEHLTSLTRKLAPPLGRSILEIAIVKLKGLFLPVTLLSTEPEIQYVSLRNINLVVQKRFVL